MRALLVAVILLWACRAWAQIFCIEDNNGNPYHGPVIVQGYGVMNLAGTVDVDLLSWANERRGRWERDFPIPEIWTIVVPTDGRSPTMVFDLAQSADGLQILELRTSQGQRRNQTWHRLKPTRVLNFEGRPLAGATVLVTGTTAREQTNRKGQIWGSSFWCEKDAELIVFHSGYDVVVQAAEWQQPFSDFVELTDIPLDFPLYGGILVDVGFGNDGIVTPDDQLVSGYVRGQRGLYYVQLTDGSTNAVYDVAFHPMQEIAHSSSPSDRLSMSLRLVRQKERVHWATDRGAYPPISAKVGSLISRQATDPKHLWLASLQSMLAQWRLTAFTLRRIGTIGLITGMGLLAWFPRKRWRKLFRRIRPVSTKPSTPPSLSPSA